MGDDDARGVVVAAVIERGGRVLISQRLPGRGLVWTARSGPLELRFHRCGWRPGQRPRAVEVAQFRWVRREDLPRYPFPPADAGLVRALADGRV